MANPRPPASRGLPPATAFLTDIPARTPRFKLYATLGLARSAFSHGDGRHSARVGQLYELKNGAWQPVHDIAPGTPVHELPWRRGTS